MAYSSHYTSSSSPSHYAGSSTKHRHAYASRQHSSSPYNSRSFTSTPDRRSPGVSFPDLTSQLSKLTTSDILPRTIDFVDAKKSCNARPSYRDTTSDRSRPGSGIVRGPSRPNRQLCTAELTRRINTLEEWGKDHLRAVGGGLSNLGNSCFMNATLQCLAYTPHFAQLLLQKLDPISQKGGSSYYSNTSYNFCLFSELTTLLPRMLKKSYGSIQPSNVFKNLRSLSKEKRLRPGRQEDAHEFLRILMDSLQTSVLKSHNAKKLSMPIQETSCIYKIWGGHLRSQVKCDHCHFESNTFDSLLDLSLEINGDSVNKALISFTRKERLTGDNRYHCERCKTKRDATKQFTIFNAPNCLVLHLKRFSFNMSMLSSRSYGGYGGSIYGGGGYSRYGTSSFGGGKISKHIEFEKTLDLSPFMSDAKTTKYSLFGCLVHSGYSAQSGHYYSYIKAPNGMWHCMNDSSVSKSNEREVLRQQAYILFYKKVASSSRPQTASGTRIKDIPTDTSPYRDRSVRDLRGSTTSPKSAAETKLERLRRISAQMRDRDASPSPSPYTRTNPFSADIADRYTSHSRQSSLSNGNGYGSTGRATTKYQVTTSARDLASARHRNGLSSRNGLTSGNGYRRTTLGADSDSPASSKASARSAYGVRSTSKLTQARYRSGLDASSGSPDLYGSRFQVSSRVKPIGASSKEQYYRRNIDDIYQTHNPMVCTTKLMEKHIGRLESLYTRVCAKYNVRPKLFVQSYSSYTQNGDI